MAGFTCLFSVLIIFSIVICRYVILNILLSSALYLVLAILVYVLFPEPLKQIEWLEHIFTGSLITGVIYGGVFGNRPRQAAVPSKYRFTLKLSNGREIYFTNPFDNFIIYGGAGAGKTKSVGKPLLSEYLRHNFAGFIYDFKDYDYTKTAYYLTQKLNYPHKFCPVNFVDPSTSMRFNLIKPSVLTDVLLIQMMDDLLMSRVSKASDRNDWFYAALGLLKGVAYRFYIDFPQICTLPHVINFITQSDSERLEALLRANPRSKALAGGFLDSKNSEKTRASIQFTLSNYLSDLAFNTTVQYILSGDDFDFDLLNPDEPKLLAVANSYALEAIISPIITVLASTSSRKFSKDNEVDFVYFLDEATTTRIPDFEKMPSVLREFRCSFVLLTQSDAKIEKLYGKLDRSSIEANFSNLLIGRTKDTEAIKRYSLFFAKKTEKKKTYTQGKSGSSSNSSTSVSELKELKYEPHFYTKLKPGEFVGNASNSNFEEFHLKFKMYDDSEESAVPIFRIVLPKDIEDNYQGIINDVMNMEI